VGRYGESGRSPYGAEDMAGNVFEWTESLFSEEEEYRVLRGGCWAAGSDYVACSYRLIELQLIRGCVVGFRCART
jgi:formylglycine-generating enzyme required for sulfatase activity